MSKSGKKPPQAPPGCDNDALVNMISGMITFTKAANSFIRQNESNKEKAICQKELEDLLLNLNQKLLEICACSNDKDKAGVSSKASKSSKSNEPPCDEKCPCSCQGKDKSQSNAGVICGCSANAIKPSGASACKNLPPLKCNNQPESNDRAQSSQSTRNKTKRSALPLSSQSNNNCKKGEACLQKSCVVCNPPIQNEKTSEMQKQENCSESCTGIKKKVSISAPGKVEEENSSNKSNEEIIVDNDGDDNAEKQEIDVESPGEVQNEDENVQDDVEEENLINLDTSGKVDECECTDQEDIVSSSSCACQPEIIQCEIDSPYKKLAMLRELKIKLNEAEKNLADLQSEIKRFGRSVSSEKEACRSPVYSAKLYKQIMKATTSIENIVQDTSPYMRKVTQCEQYRLLPSVDVERRMTTSPARREASTPRQSTPNQRNNSPARKGPFCVPDSSSSRTPLPQFYTVCGQPSGTVFVDCRGVSRDGEQAEESFQDTMDDFDGGCFNPQQCKR